MSEWQLSTSPEEYLERYGEDAKNSELAQRIIAEREDEGPADPDTGGEPETQDDDGDRPGQIAALRESLESLRETLAAEEARATEGAERRDAKWRSHHLEALSRDVRQLELRHQHVPDTKVKRGIEVATKVLERLPTLSVGESMWDEDEHEVFHQFADQRR